MSENTGASEATSAGIEDEILAERRQSRRRQRLRAWGVRLAALAIFLGVWQALPALGLVRFFFISSPVAVVRDVISLLGQGATWYSVWETFEAAMLALAVGGAIGIACGVAFSHLPAVRQGLNPFVTVMNALPRPALAPLFIMWFGLGQIPKVLVGISIVFFILLLNTIAGLTAIDADVLKLSQSLGITGWRRFRTIEFPWALPSIIAGLRLGAVYAVLGVVVSEIVAAYYGLGTMLVKSTNSFDVSQTFAILILTAAIATALDVAISLMQRRLSYGGEVRRSAL